MKVRCAEGLFDIQRNDSLWPLTHSGVRVSTTTALNFSECLSLAHWFSTAHNWALGKQGSAIVLRTVIKNLVSDIDNDGPGGLIALQRLSALGGSRVAFSVWQIVTLIVAVVTVLAFAVVSVAVDQQSKIKCRFNTVSGISRLVGDDVLRLNNSPNPQQSIEMGHLSSHGSQFIGILRDGENTSICDLDLPIAGRGNIDQIKTKTTK